MKNRSFLRFIYERKYPKFWLIFDELLKKLHFITQNRELIESIIFEDNFINKLEEILIFEPI
jgi:hypothetical protein